MNEIQKNQKTKIKSLVQVNLKYVLPEVKMDVLQLGVGKEGAGSGGMRMK